MDSITTMANDDQEKDKEEVTLIVVDNSWRMWSAASLGAYYNQLEAIELYCHAKLDQSNPKKNAIGLYALGNPEVKASYLKPTSDVDKILAHLHQGIRYGGDLDLSCGIPLSMTLLNRCRGFKHKRLLVFVGSPSLLPDYTASRAGQTLKLKGVAVDVVNFSLLESCKTALDEFVAAADNIGNSHIEHVPPGSPLPLICEALSRLSSSPIITSAIMEQEEIAAATRKKIAKDKADRNAELVRLQASRLLGRKGPAPPPKVPKIDLGKKFGILFLGNEKAMGGI